MIVNSLVQAGFIQKVHMGKPSGLASDLVCVKAHFGDIAVLEQLLHLCVTGVKRQITHIRYVIASNLHSALYCLFSRSQCILTTSYGIGIKSQIMRASYKVASNLQLASPCCSQACNAF